MVDAAISYPKEIGNISLILNDPAFVCSCALSSSQVKKYDDFSWNLSNIIDYSQNGWFFYNFLKRAAWRVVSLSNFGHIKPDEFEDVCSIVLENVADAVGKFHPVSKASPDRTWGFEAYLQNYSVKKSIRSVLKLLTGGDGRSPTSFVSIEGEGFGGEAKNLELLEAKYPDLFSVVGDGDKLFSYSERECKNMVFLSIKQALANHPGAQAYYYHVVSGETIRQTCERLQISKSTCHRLVHDACVAVWDKFQTNLTFQGEGPRKGERKLSLTKTSRAVHS